jgi:hypothetical protein
MNRWQSFFSPICSISPAAMSVGSKSRSKNAFVIPAWEARMFSSEVTLLLRTILNEVCAGLAEYETGKRTLVASKILESASKGERNIYMLRSVGRQALLAAPF